MIGLFAGSGFNARSRRNVRPELRAAILTALLIVGQLAMGAAPALSQQNVGSVKGVVATSSGEPLAGVTLTLSGPTSSQTSSDRSGHFSFTNLTPGLYRVGLTKAGFEPEFQTDITVVAGQNVDLTYSMKPASYQSLNVIAQVSTSKQLPLNTSAASVDVIDSDTLSLTGSHEVMQALNEIPGIVTTPNAFGSSNGLSPWNPQTVQIRGALPYETQNLIDGHPVSEGTSATFSPNFINPWLLDSIEIVKGPGYIGPDINYAVTGTVNYRTLSPTSTARESVDVDYNALLQGWSSNFRATGTTLNGHLGYALDYALFGAAGVNPGGVLQAGLFNSATTFNGQTLGDTGTFLPGNPKYITGPLATQNSLGICCYNNYGNQYTSHSELAKLQYNFSTATSLTATYLGSQQLGNIKGDQANIPGAAFVPGAGYSGSLPPGTLMPFLNASEGPLQEALQTGLFESEFRTTIGANDVFLARYYSGAQNENESVCASFSLPVCFTGSSQPVTVYGTGTLGGVPTVFNGTTGTLVNSSYYVNYVYDHFRGLSAEWDHLAGNNLYTISYDRTLHTDSAFYAAPYAAGTTFVPQIPDSSAETFQTILARAELALSPALQANFGYYDINYISHYSPNGGVSYADSEHSYNTGRFALTDRLDNDTSIRLSAGGSIAPPTISLLNVPAGPPATTSNPALFYTQTLPSGNIKPETAFSYDLGFDKRIRISSMLFSGDVYMTTLQNQFLNSVTSTGTTYSGLGGTAPLYDQQTANLGHSRYEGAELLVNRKPVSGIGFKIQGGIERAYVYDLPPNFYNTGAGPYTTNLGIIPNTNYTGSGFGYSGVGYGRIPYATGYAELNWTTPNRWFALLGLQYYGNNNAYDAPAFAVLNAAVRYSVNDRMWVQLTASNINDQLSALMPYYFEGQSVHLANGLLGYTTLNNIGPTQVSVSAHLQVGK